MVGDPSIERELGTLTAQVAVLIASDRQRAEAEIRIEREVVSLRSATEVLTRDTDTRLVAIEKKIEMLAGPVADFQALKARTGYVVTAIVIMGTSVWFVIGAPILTAVRKALGFPND